jgi:hypothetical protein
MSKSKGKQIVSNTEPDNVSKAADATNINELTNNSIVSNDNTNIDEPQFEVVKESKMGRPVWLTTRRFVRICKHIEQGSTSAEACQLESVTYRAFRMRVVRNPEFARRLKTAEEAREKFWFEFHMANVKRHAGKNLLASLWWLERRHPNLFALKNVIREIDPDAKVIGEKLTESELLEIQERMTDFARKNQNDLLHSPPTGESSAEPNPLNPEGQEPTNQGLVTQ